MLRAEVEVTPDLNLETYSILNILNLMVGKWSCSQNISVEVTISNNFGRKQWCVYLRRKRQEVKKLIINWTSINDINCGHYTLILNQSSKDRLIWKEFNNGGWIHYWVRRKDNHISLFNDKVDIENMLIRLIRNNGGKIFVSYLGSLVFNDMGLSFKKLSNMTLEKFIESRKHLFIIVKDAIEGSIVMLVVKDPPGL